MYIYIYIYIAIPEIDPRPEAGTWAGRSLRVRREGALSKMRSDPCPNHDQTKTRQGSVIPKNTF